MHNLRQIFHRNLSSLRSKSMGFRHQNHENDNKRVLQGWIYSLKAWIYPVKILSQYRSAYCLQIGNKAVSTRQKFGFYSKLSYFCYPDHSLYKRSLIKRYALKYKCWRVTVNVQVRGARFSRMCAISLATLSSSLSWKQIKRLNKNHPVTVLNK